MNCVGDGFMYVSVYGSPQEVALLLAKHGLHKLQSITYVHTAILQYMCITILLSIFVHFCIGLFGNDCGIYVTSQYLTN